MFSLNINLWKEFKPLDLVYRNKMSAKKKMGKKWTFMYNCTGRRNKAQQGKHEVANIFHLTRAI